MILFMCKTQDKAKLIYGNKSQNHNYLREQVLTKLGHQRTLWGIGIYYVLI